MANAKGPILLHICCAGCGAFVAKALSEEGYEVFLYYYNPNIDSVKEYEMRAGEVERIARLFGYGWFIEGYDHISWLEKVRTLEQEPEKGRRCSVCYQARLGQAALFAKNNGFSVFATTLSVSPYKVVSEINRIGQELASESNLEFLDRDFKKQDGFKKAAELSRELNIYRQNYCGCEFSRKIV